jgi:urease accessory protein
MARCSTAIITTITITPIPTITRPRLLQRLGANSRDIDEMRDGGQSAKPAALTAAEAPLPAPLLLWLSPSFPVGAFAFSHGLEWAAEQGWIKDRPTLQAWLADLITLGSAKNDMILLAAASCAATTGDDATLKDVLELASAMQPSAERHLEAVTQGGAFLAQIEAAWPCEAVERLKTLQDGEIAYAVAVGVAAAGHAIPLSSTLQAYGLAFLGNLVSAAVRLGVIGQTDGQKVLAALVPAVNEAAERAATATLDALGSACWRSDLASLQHETQYTRLFRS